MRSVRYLRQHVDELKACLACGGRGEALIRLFTSGNEAPAAVLATTLYQRLPTSGDDNQQARPGGGRKLLLFSDSRQSAAYFAPYLEDWYNRLQRRRLLIEGVGRAVADEREVGLDDVVYHTARAADSFGVFERRQSRQARGEQSRYGRNWKSPASTTATLWKGGDCWRGGCCVTRVGPRRPPWLRLG